MKYLLLLLLAGCASNLTEEDRAYRDVVDRGNWEACNKLYLLHGKPTFHTNHRHMGGRKTHSRDVRGDLTENHCRMIMGDSWMNY